LGQKQYPSALVRYLASARAEVFQFGFLLLSSSSVFQSAAVPDGITMPNQRQAGPLYDTFKDTIN
jgi:hypothetical protein